MATGATPALDPKSNEAAAQAAETTAEQPSEAKPITLKERIIRTLTHIFMHNEDLGVTRQQ